MDIDNRMALYQHVVLSGGTMLLPGLPTRLEREIRAHYLQEVLRVRITPPLDKCCDATPPAEGFWITSQLTMTRTVMQPPCMQGPCYMCCLSADV